MRVISGELRGRRLRAAGRPTSERARAALFDAIGPGIADAALLDLFAGSGALGIEALSRGAHSVVFVENDRAALATLRRNVSDLDLRANSRVVARDALRATRDLARAQERFDWVLADPPYGEGWGVRLGKIPELLDVLAPEAVLIFERSKRDTPGELARVGLQLEDSRRYGETVFDWYRGVPAGD